MQQSIVRQRNTIGIAGIATWALCLVLACPAVGLAASGFHSGDAGSGFHPGQPGAGGGAAVHPPLGNLLGILGFGPGQPAPGGWSTSPNNWDNSEKNWDNGPQKWDNNPKNWANDPRNRDSKRIVYDNQGRPIGYIVPKGNGGANYFDLSGHRKAYLPPNR